MMRSLFSGVSGLKNHQTRMDVIGNNISNVNTTGFKSSRVTFVDTLNQTMTGASAATDNLGGTNPKQVGLGSAVASIDTLFTDGTVQSTGKNTDLCLSGNGLFVVKNGSQEYYTRDGAFEFDAEGNYVLPGSGLKVQGWNAVDGVLNTNATAVDVVVPAGKSMASEATAITQYANNLNAASLTIDSMSGGTSVNVATASAPVAISAGTNTYYVTNGGFSSTETYTIAAVAQGATSITVTDSSGNTQTLTLTQPAAAAAAATVTSVTGPDKVGTATSPVIINDGNNNYSVTNGAFFNGLNYTISKAVAAGDTSIEVTDSAGYVQTLSLAKPSTTTTAANTPATFSGGTTRASATASITDPVTLTMSDGTKVIQTNGTYTTGYSLPITTTISIYDTLGNVHSLPIYFTKTSIDSVKGNTWTVSLTTDGTGSTALAEADGTITTVTMADTTLDFDTSGKYDTTRNNGGRKTALTLTDGAKQSQTVTLELSSITQYAGNNTINGTTDGHAAGTLESVSIDASGIITGTYTNGVRQYEAQVAIAQFTNASGLTKTGTSLYQTSSNSGTPNIKTATDLGVKITASALEMSNVDIANEFADMIITQRGFQSNSKIITVGDEMLETVINMKR